MSVTARQIKPKKRFVRPVLPILIGLFAIIGVIVITLASASTVIGDINNDGKVDVFDLSGLLGKWGSADAAADLNHDGTVNIFDLSLLLAHWGQTAPAATPSTIVLNDASTGTGLNQFNFVGAWSVSTPAGAYNTDNHFSNTAGDYYQVQFSGTQAKIYAEKGPDLGIVGISVDGGIETMVDPYAGSRSEQQLLYTSPALSDATHTIKVRITGTKNTSATAIYAAADRIDITTGTNTSTPGVSPSPTPSTSGTPGPIAGVSASNPCVGSAAPAKWNHVVVLFFENKYYSDVIGNSAAPFISGLASHCATATNFLNAEFNVTGGADGTYDSKPSYATFMTGLSPTVHGITVDDYGVTSDSDNMFNRLKQMGLDTKSYQSGAAGQCDSSNFDGAYHDPMRYFTDLGGQSSDPSTYCNTHDVTIGSFMTDVNSGKLPAFSIIIPTNNQNMHNNDVASGDTWANNFLTPFLDSAQYKSGDTALFFMWDEHTPIPNALIAPSIKPGTKIGSPTSGNPITDYSATRTWQEMLGVSPLLGVSGQAPSLLHVYNGQ